jgi:hypothetical protein
MRTLGRRSERFRFADYYRPIFRLTPLKVAGEKRFSLSVGFSFQQEEFSYPLRSWDVNAGGAED